MEEIKSIKEFLIQNGTDYKPMINKPQWDAAFRIFNAATGKRKKNTCSSCRGEVYKWFMKNA